MKKPTNLEIDRHVCRYYTDDWSGTTISGPRFRTTKKRKLIFCSRYPRDVCLPLCMFSIWIPEKILMSEMLSVPSSPPLSTGMIRRVPWRVTSMVFWTTLRFLALFRSQGKIKGLANERRNMTNENTKMIKLKSFNWFWDKCVCSWELCWPLLTAIMIIN